MSLTIVDNNFLAFSFMLSRCIIDSMLEDDENNLTNSILRSFVISNFRSNLHKHFFISETSKVSASNSLALSPQSDL